jgi:cysteine desulfurase family protein (TIGR01976 family)
MSTATDSTATAQLTATGKSQAKIKSIAEIRGQFPAVQRKHAGLPVAYFDGPGGTQVPQSVVDSVADYLCYHNANTHWNYPTSAETDEAIAAARQALADLVGGDADEIVFGANATTLAFHVSRALAGVFSSGDEIVVTELDHHANVGPWQALARERDCKLQVVRMLPAAGTLDWDDFEQKVSGRTKLIAIGAASNALGTVNDVGRAVKLARSVGALTFVDAVHYTPHFLTDVRAWDCDFLVCSAYKFYGPHIGVLWCRGELLGSLPFPKVLPAPDTGPDRAETGTLNHEGIAGACAAVSFLASLTSTDLRTTSESRREQLQIAYLVLHERSLELVDQLWNGLAKTQGVKLYGPNHGAPRTPTVAFTVNGIASAEVSRRLAERGLFLSHGNFYAATVVDRLGLTQEGLVRAGCACYTSAEEVDRLVAAVRDLAADRCA